MKKNLNLVFAGTPSFAASILCEVLKIHAVAAVYTQPDRPTGRGQKLIPCPVKAVAQQHNIPIFQPKSLRSAQVQTALTALKPDLIIVVAYGLILPKAILELPRYGCLNVHASLLPRWRGAAPIQRAILNGDSETGVTIMKMDEGLDTGEMLLKKSYKIAATDTSQDLHDHLARLGSEALLKVLEQLEELHPEKQDHAQSCYAEKIQKQEGRIDWQLSALEIQRRIRAFNPWPGTFTFIDGQLLKIWQAEVIDQSNTQPPGIIIAVTKSGIDLATGSGILRITHCQLAGSKAMSVANLLNAKRNLFQIGKQL